MLRRTLPLLLVLAPLVARAQTPAPLLIQSSATIQLPAPTNDRVRLQILLAGTPTVLDDERANVQNGVAVARLEADPGTYDVRVVSNDKTRVPLGPSRRFVIPGLKREAGRWLFNGSLVAYAGTNPAPTTSFVPNLRRDEKKTKLPFVFPTSALLKWDVLPRTYPAGTDNRHLFVGAMASAAIMVAGALPIGEGNYVLMRPSATPAIANAAAIFSTDNPIGPLNALAPQSDAVVIQGNNQTLLKIARRNAEEAPDFDLPIFAQFSMAPTASEALQAFQAGASGLIVPEGAATNPVLDILTRNSARLSGAVTLEDVGLRASDFERFAPVLRRAGRVPLLARLPGEGNGRRATESDDKIAESLLIAFDEKTDAATLDKIERAAKVGATIYCEGALPPALFPRWSEITKVQIAPAPTPKTQTLVLDDPWFWGTINDQNFDVRQTLALTVKPSISSQIKDEKGKAIETVARPIAHFNGDPNAIMLCPVGRGRIIWAPFNVTPSEMQKAISSTGLAYGYDWSPAGNALRTAYYSAIAGAMQPALVTYEAQAGGGDAAGVSVALRATRTDPNDANSVAATLVAFFNSSNAPVDLEASVRGDGPYVLDLETDKTISATVRDFSTRVALTVPANGYRWIVVAKDAQTWNDSGKGSVRARLR